MAKQEIYTSQQVEEIAQKAAQYAVEHILLSLDLENRDKNEPPTMEGEENMGRQRIHITLPNGKPVWITGATYTDLIQNALNKYGTAKPQPAASETFKEYTDHIFDIFLRPRWRPSTADTNKFLLDKHINPFFGDIPLNQIDTAFIQQFFQTKQHLSKSYTRQMLIMLHEILANAVEDGKILSDPTTSKRITLPDKATKRNALEAEQFYNIISHLSNLAGDEALLIALLCFTGMRRGEVLGLQWDSVLDDKILVRSEIIFKGNTPVYNEYTKSKSGLREIPLMDELKPFLCNRQTGFVLGNDHPYTQSKFDRMWQRIGKKINLYGATPHIFRHTYLTMLAASGVDPKTIQALAGHADFNFTFDRYVDKDKNNMLDAGSQFSQHIKDLTRRLTDTKDTKPNNINGLQVTDQHTN